ncbi:hypothetical protein OO015_11815 [Thermomicrobium sp. 4228-Ro]|uniref:hypothetical protein n=1 Tax=Thermomicrobium sp. 4228-Ro TaxID=2993937 RepID=UPI0022492AEB|nr:hypothetical protein [Thermomicrobium sp. 4228-Ro]MCX2728177.1 hypothetical protein [Thermomicrobium sp. 4228-Ro]
MPARRWLSVLGRLFLLLNLTLPFFTAHAATPQQLPTTLVVPFLPNGEHYGDTGPWYGTIALQNPESVPLDLTLRTTSGAELKTVRVEPHAHATVTASELFGTCRRYPATVRQHTTDGLDRVDLPTAALHVDRVEIAGYQPGIDYTWGALAGEVWIDWSPPGWEPEGPYTAIIVDCPDGQPVVITATAPVDALASDTTACVARTEPVELAAVKGAPDTADAVLLPKGIGPVTVVEVRYGTRYAGSLGLADPTALDTSGRWLATVSGDAITIDWGAAPSDDDGTIPTGARYTVIAHVRETICREPRFAAQLLLTAGQPAGADGVTDGATLVSSLPVAPAPDPASLLTVPLVQWHNGWTTVLHVAHRGLQSCGVTVTIRDGAGLEKWSGSRTLEAGQVWHLDLREASLASGFLGSAWIRSSCGALASADRIKPSHQLALSALAVEARTGPTDLLVPIIYAAHSGWNTGLAFTNLAQAPVTVDLVFVDPTGAPVRTERRTLAPLSQEILYRPDLPPTVGIIGNPTAPIPALATLHIRATGPIGVLADTVKYTPTGGRAFTLPAVAPVAAGTSLLFPLALASAPGDVTGLAVANASTVQAPTTVELWPLDTPTPLRLSFVLPGRGLGIVYLPEQLRTLTRFAGTAIAWSDAGTLAAAGMQVNETIPGDGAAGTPLAPGWVPPVLGVQLLPTWDGLGLTGQPDVALGATGLPGTPLVIEVVSGTATLGTDAGCATTTPLQFAGTGTLERTLWLCSVSWGDEPTFTVRLWWDRGTTPGAVDAADTLVGEELVRLPQ